MDIPTLIPIQVAAVTDTTGNITPMWLRYQDSAELIHKATISVRQRKEDRVRLTYNCWLIEDDRKALVELYYHISDHKWSMKRF